MITQPRQCGKIADRLNGYKRSPSFDPSKQMGHDGFERETVMQHSKCDNNINGARSNILNHPADSFNAISNAIELCSLPSLFQEAWGNVESIDSICSKECELGGDFPSAAPEIEDVTSFDWDVFVNPFLR